LLSAADFLNFFPCCSRGRTLESSNVDSGIFDPSRSLDRHLNLKACEEELPHYLTSFRTHGQLSVGHTRIRAPAIDP
jgi:hypothetical protein